MSLIFACTRRPAAFSLLLFLTLLCHSHADAEIVTVSGDIEEIAPPASVQFHVLQNNLIGAVFQERADYQLLANTQVSIPGTVGTYDETSDLNSTSLAAGTVVNSYLLHFDPRFGGPQFQGSVQFSQPIVGVMLLTSDLDDSDGELGAPGSQYPTSANPRRGLDFEDFTNLDTFIISAERTIQFDLGASNAVDQIRVVTGATNATSVPEPANAMLCSVLTASLGIFVCLRRRNGFGPRPASMRNQQ